VTELLYQTDSYLKEFSALVTAVDQEAKAIILDRSAYYPGGGGQPSDIGELKIEDHSYKITKTKKTGPNVMHFVGDELPLPLVGSHVEGIIDWERRYKLKGRMDFEFETMRKELVVDIQKSINVEVANARNVFINILPREQAFQIPDLIRTKINLLPDNIKEVRVVEIEALDLQADGGTHVKNTREVGKIRVTDYKSKGKINKRIYIDLE
jgi:misacylated tRNA(Ala) deacylase